MSRKFRISDAAIYCCLAIVALVTLLPMLYIVSISFSTDKALATYGGTLIPVETTLYAYKQIFHHASRIVQTFRNSLIITGGGTLFGLIVTAGLAYPLSRKYLPYRKGFMIFIFITMLFSGGLVPYYLTVKELGLINTLWSIIIPGALNSWNMILMRNFFMEIPVELEESARIDGANEIRILFSIFLPVSKPIIATISLFFAVGFWNNWFGPLLFLNNSSFWPLMMFLKQVIQSPNVANEVMQYQNESVPPSESMKMAVVVIATAPILLVYPFVQKYFVKGMIVGSIKG